jgi:hypothetical protein
MRILLPGLAVLLAQLLQVNPPPPPVPLFVDEFARGGAIPLDGEGVVQGSVRRVDTGEGLRDVAIRLTRGQASKRRKFKRGCSLRHDPAMPMSAHGA